MAVTIHYESQFTIYYIGEGVTRFANLDSNLNRPDVTPYNRYTVLKDRTFINKALQVYMSQRDVVDLPIPTIDVEGYCKCLEGAMKERILIRSYLTEGKYVLNNELRSYKFKGGIEDKGLSLETRMKNAKQLKQQFSLGGFITVTKSLEAKWQIIREMLTDEGWFNSGRSSLSFSKTKDVYHFRLQKLKHPMFYRLTQANIHKSTPYSVLYKLEERQKRTDNWVRFTGSGNVAQMMQFILKGPTNENKSDSHC